MTKREEVAKKIRKIDEYDCYEMAIYEIDKIIGTEKSPLFSDFLNRLADLIDPTCMVAYVKGKTICCNCGNDEVFDDYLYCPKCGARLMRYDL